MVIALFPEAYILGLQIFEQIMLVHNHVPHVYNICTSVDIPDRNTVWRL